MERAQDPRDCALDRLNRLPTTRYHRRLAWMLGFIFLFDHADINTLSFAAPAIIKFWHVSVSTIAVLISATFLGMFAGATIGGWLSDRIGRKRSLIYATLWYTSFSLLNGLAWNPQSLFVARLFTGIGISAMTVVGIAYISEIFPARVRGTYQGWIMVIGLLGVPMTAYVARFCIPLAPWGWRLVFVWGSLGLLFVLFSHRIEESPRWYENQGRFDEADAVLDRVEAQVRQEVGSLPPVTATTAMTAIRRGTYTDLLIRANLGQTLVQVSAWIFLTLGFFGFTSWVPTLLVLHGISLVHSLVWSSAMSLAIIPGAVLAALVADRWDRKWSIIVVALIIAVCGLFYGLTFRASAIIIFGLLVEMFLHMFTPLMYTYTAESFASEMRNSGTGLAYGAGRLANVWGPLLVAFLFGHYGYRSVFAYITLSWVLVSLILGIFGRRSRSLV